MKKTILTLLFAFLGFTTTFASFPVTENINTIEVVETENTTVESPAKVIPKWGNLSLIMGLAWMPLFMIGFAFAWNGDEGQGLALIIASIASFIGAIVTGFVSLRKGETSKWKAIIGLALTAGLIVLSMVSAAMEGVGMY